MKKNVGGADQAFRLVLGIASISLGFYFDSWWGAVGLVFLFTAFAGWCPVYLPLKISTRKSQ